MFEDNHMDKDELLLKSILENAEEEVPSRVWSGVAEGLDRFAGRRRFVWLGSSVAAVAAAAALVVGVVFGHGEDNIVPETAGDMIAVVESANSEDVLLAKADETVSPTGAPVASSCRQAVISDKPSAVQSAPSAIQGTPSDISAESSAPSGQSYPEPPTQVATENSTATESSEVVLSTSEWEDEGKDARKNRIRTSLVLSGIAGTNSPQARGNIGPFKASGILSAPSKTTVEQVGEQIIYGVPVSAGVGVKLHLTKRWSLGMGLNYTLLTSKFNGKYTKVENGIPSVPISEYVRNTQHYIGIPVNAYYNIISCDFINFYAYAGGTVEKCVGNHYQLLSTTAITHKESVSGVQLSANLGMGVEFMLGRYVGLYLDPSLRYYFKSDQPKSIRTAQPLMLGFELGLRFNL